MRMYLGRDSHSATDMTATHAIVRHLTSRVEGLGHKIFMDNFFSSPRLFDDLERRNINLYRAVWPNRKSMPCDFGSKQMKLKRGDIKMRTSGGLTALVWNREPPPAKGNFCNSRNSPVKLHIVERYNRHMGYINNSDRMVNIYLMN